MYLGARSSGANRCLTVSARDAVQGLSQAFVLFMIVCPDQTTRGFSIVQESAMVVSLAENGCSLPSESLLQ